MEYRLVMSSKKSRAMNSTNGKARRKRLRRITKCHKIISPEVGSLYDLLHDYASISLYLPPVAWTDFHKQVLGCRFVQLPPQNIPTPSSSSPRIAPPIRTPQTVISIGRDVSYLMEGLNAYTRLQAMKSVIDTLYPSSLWSTPARLTMRCGKDQLSGAVRCQAMWKKRKEGLETASISSFSSSEDSTVEAPYDTPVLAYLDLGNLDDARGKCYRIPHCPNGSPNFPIYRLHMTRSRKLIPKNPDEDQYILATMLAMAQQHVYGSMFSGRGFAPKDVQVRVMTTSSKDESFIVYSSVVPAAFLSMFHEPHKAPRGDARVIIEYQHVPVWPVLGFKERLGRALGKDIVGEEFDETHMESFESQTPSNAEGGSYSLKEEMDDVFKTFGKGDAMTPKELFAASSPKRKREILSEVLNASFSEDRDVPDVPDVPNVPNVPDFPSELLAKRRCFEEGRVGVVQ
ncbi:hypothetical protein F4677DRAFT_190599 [Hypoxylon crocopeplum]|nr:hypothetical protein F4677DRAFT_190599 [Hypoxylon crocopeplum]